MSRPVFYTILCMFLLCLAADSPAQAVNLWRSYQDNTVTPGYMEAIDVVTEPDNDAIFVTGYTRSGAARKDDIYVAKYSKTGALVWLQYYDGSFNNDDRPTAIAIDGADNVYVVGYSIRGTNAKDFVLVKFNTVGAFQWARTYHGGFGDDTGQDVGVDLFGNIVVTGQSRGSSFDGIATLKFSPSGGVHWVRRHENLSGRSNIRNSKLAIDPSGNIYMGCTSNDPITTGQNIMIVRYDLSSALAWSLEYDQATNTDNLLDIAVGPDGVYACGASGNGTGLPEAVILKRDFAGAFQWAETYAPASSTNNESVALAVSNAGDAFATGTAIIGGLSDMVTWKVSSAGVFQWARVEHVDVRFTIGEDIAVDAFGNSYACGRKHGPGDSPAAFVIRYNPNGTTNWSDLRNEGNNDTSLAIAVDSKGDVITGSLTDGVTNDLMMIQKFIQMPVANADSYAAVEGNTRTVAAPGIRLNDVFIDSAVAEGVTETTKGLLTLNPNGSFTYRPNVGQSGADSFTYRLQKNVMESNVAAVSFTIVPLSPSTLTFSPNVIYSGQTTTGTVTLNGAAFTGGVFVGITRNSLALLGPDSVAVPAGATSATFPIKAGPVSATAVRTVTVTRSAISRTASITIHPSPALVSLVISPNVVVGGASTTGRVTLASASPPGGLPVGLHSASGSVTVPSSVTVPAGATFANFPISTSAVGSTFVRTVTATLNGVTRSANLTLNPP